MPYTYKIEYFDNDTDLDTSEMTFLNDNNLISADIDTLREQLVGYSNASEAIMANNIYIGVDKENGAYFIHGKKQSDYFKSLDILVAALCEIGI